jgi:hypothetical protein
MSSARLAILLATTHYDIFSSPGLASTVAPLRDAPMPEGGCVAPSKEYGKPGLNH